MTDMDFAQPVSAPPETVFGYFAHLESYPEFMRAVERVRRDKAAPQRVYWIFSLAGMLREYATDVEIDTRSHELRWRSTRGPDHRGGGGVTPESGGTSTLSLHVEFHPSGAAEQLGDAFGLIRSRISADLRGFARYVETEGAHSPSGRRVAATSTPDDRPRSYEERLSDLIFKPRESGAGETRQKPHHSDDPV
ncbi:MAG: SRPBCC family protein [Streptosporangiales bacterium]